MPVREQSFVMNFTFQKRLAYGILLYSWILLFYNVDIYLYWEREGYDYANIFVSLLRLLHIFKYTPD